MGRIKSTLIKRTSRKLVESSKESFTDNFEDNKKALGNTTLPSKKLRNKIAGYIARINKNNKKIIPEQDGKE